MILKVVDSSMALWTEKKSKMERDERPRNAKRPERINGQKLKRAHDEYKLIIDPHRNIMFSARDCRECFIACVYCMRERVWSFVSCIWLRGISYWGALKRSPFTVFPYRPTLSLYCPDCVQSFGVRRRNKRLSIRV